MNINVTARGGRLCSSVNCRRVPAGVSRSHHQMSSIRFGRWIHGLQPLRVTGSECAQLPLVHAVATVKIDRGPQCKNTKPGCNRKIQSQTRAVNGIAALVTTPLRLLVTSAPSDQACPAPGGCLSQRMCSIVGADLRSMTTCPLGSTGAAERGPALGTRVRHSRCRGGRTWGLSGQL